MQKMRTAFSLAYGQTDRMNSRLWRVGRRLDLLRRSLESRVASADVVLLAGLKRFF
ncbi:hypothetical protein SAMN06265338_1281 [Rhodoblastus acidophilus]|uniref:Uncharacterized protein n=1 Tax=Rhodoblastus acidophilus TaxID=1074 RepID=A0A212SDB4_RHOAC|nr:hypothetical protein SAMN06265338_1281 [Rhodoblastus acidophilus]